MENLEEVPVSSADSALELFLEGSKKRNVASTAMNSGSSRSHSVFILNLESQVLIFFPLLLLFFSLLLFFFYEFTFFVLFDHCTNRLNYQWIFWAFTTFSRFLLSFSEVLLFFFLGVGVVFFLVKDFCNLKIFGDFCQFF